MFCTNCGSAIVAGGTFCTNCGAKNNANATQPTRQPSVNAYNQPTYTQTQLQQPLQFAYPTKTKTPAVLLAVFLGGWAWLYTYRADASKFWISLGVGFFLWLVNFAAPGIGILNLGFWIWAIVDVANKSDSWYATYWQRWPGTV
jgi:hypothetical protein